ncbi:hypothetical protein SprV_0301186100 [Sparganum proliferum]
MLRNVLQIVVIAVLLFTSARAASSEALRACATAQGLIPFQGKYRVCCSYPSWMCGDKMAYGSGSSWSDAAENAGKSNGINWFCRLFATCEGFKSLLR